MALAWSLPLRMVLPGTNVTLNIMNLTLLYVNSFFFNSSLSSLVDKRISKDKERMTCSPTKSSSLPASFVVSDQPSSSKYVNIFGKVIYIEF